LIVFIDRKSAPDLALREIGGEQPQDGELGEGWRFDGRWRIGACLFVRECDVLRAQLPQTTPGAESTQAPARIRSRGDHYPRRRGEALGRIGQ
jgi:hypothetical protein